MNKYNIGDKVWIVEYYTKYINGIRYQYYKPLKVKITNIIIEISVLGTEIQYRSTDTDLCLLEDEVFKTKKETQAECMKQEQFLQKGEML